MKLKKCFIKKAVFKSRKSSEDTINQKLHDYIRSAVINGMLSKDNDRALFSVSDLFLDSLYPKIKKSNRKKILEGRKRCIELYNIYYKPLITSKKVHLVLIDADNIGVFAKTDITFDGKVHKINDLLGYRSQSTKSDSDNHSICEFQLQRNKGCKRSNINDNMFRDTRCHVLLGGIAFLNHACSKCSNCTTYDPSCGDEEEVKANAFLEVFVKVILFE